MKFPSKPALARLAVTLPVTAAIVAVGFSSAPPAEGYSAAQVARGREVYQTSCLFCHGGNLQGSVGPALAGANARVGNLPSAQHLFDYLKATMPLTAPGSLSDDEYWAVSAFIMAENGVPQDGETLGPSNASSLPVAGGGYPPISPETIPEEVVPEDLPAEPEAALEELPAAPEPEPEAAPETEPEAGWGPVDEPVAQPTAEITTDEVIYPGA